MTALPVVSEFTGSTVTEAQFKTAISNLRGYLSGLLGDDGTLATALDTLGGLGSNMVAKTGAYTVLAADKGTVFLCSGTWTLSLTAAATLGGKFSFAVINTGTGVITIDPNASELIGGATTKALGAGESCIVTCDGTAFYVISGGGGNADTVDGIHAATTATANKLLACNASAVMPCSITGNAAGLSAILAVAIGGTGATTASGAADNLSVVKRDHGYSTVGSITVACTTSAVGSAVGPGATVAGSYLTGGFKGEWGALSGTWRALCYSPYPGTGIFQRIS